MIKRTWIAIGLAVVAGAVAAIVDAADARPRGTLTAQVTYKWQPCSGASDRLAGLKRVTAGTLELRRAGKTVRVSLVDGGTVPGRIALAGNGAISATLVLQTPRVRITGSGGGAERIPLGTHRAVNGRISFSVGSSEERNGHVNTLIQLQRAARVAAVTAPRQLPLVKVDVHDGPVGARPATGFNPPDDIQVGQAAGADAQWEPTPLIHEYGHFVLYTIARDGPDAGDHDGAKSYPTKPTLAWSEGFAHAFAAVVIKEGGGLLFVECKPYFNLASTPPRPTLASKVDERYAQYNETRVGAATYRLVQRLGGGEAGLKRLLTALPTYHRDGHSVWTARDLRDLAAQQFERSGADQAAIDGLFFSEGISWEAHIGVGYARESDPEFAKLRFAGATVAVRVTGPGGFDCRTTTDIPPTGFTRFEGGAAQGMKKADGGLTFAGADDCYLVSGSGRVDFKNPRTLGADQITIPFPYLAGEKHWAGAYTLYAKYHCEFDPATGGANQPYCPTAMKVRIYPFNKILVISTPTIAQGVPTTLPREVEMVVATFKANGECHVGGFDCSV